MLAYPRLPDSAALIRLHEIRQVAEEDPSRLADLSATEHSVANPVPTGATVATTAQVEIVRARVTEDLGRWLTGASVPRSETTSFDITLGKALHESLQILPSDAAHQETWNFLAAVVFPDVVWARFPDLHQDRVLGRPRNTLRRTWLRHDVIGDLQGDSTKPLGEDELTGLFERTAVAANRRLARSLAQAVLTSTAANRSQFARDLYRRVTDVTGPLLLDVLDDEDLAELVRLCAIGESWPSGAPSRDLSREFVTSSTEGEVTDPQELNDRYAVPSPAEEGGQVMGHTGGERADHEVASAPASRSREPENPQASRPTHARAGGDLVRQFHKEMLLLSMKVKDELGYAPTALLDMIDTLGGVEAARRIVGTTHASGTFVTLWEHARLDLTVERLVLDPEYQGLFSEVLLDRARYRLEEHGNTID